jgi:hypothetical protein
LPGAEEPASGENQCDSIFHPTKTSVLSNTLPLTSPRTTARNPKYFPVCLTVLATPHAPAYHTIEA